MPSSNCSIPKKTHREPFVDSVIAAHLAAYHEEPEVVACGPGRVNLIGEHTDYQGGFVFPMALNLKCACCCTLNTTGKYSITSTNMKETKDFSSFPAGPEKGAWWNYAIGAAACFFRHAKVPVPAGFNMTVGSNVPLGGGLSSSAAVEVSVATAMEVLTGHYLTQIEKAESVCQAAEHEWAGVGCGLMDQAISTMGRENHAMLLDCISKEATHAPLDDSLRVVVVNCGVKHALVDGHYDARKKKCVEAVTAIQKKHPKVNFLREATLEQLEEAKSLMDEEAYKRGSHVIRECDRCLRFFDLLKKGDWEGAGKIMYDGHASLRDIYDVSIAPIDEIVEIAKKTPGVYGARLTGGGFGGCVAVLCKTTEAENVLQHILKEYKAYFAKVDKKGNGVEFHEPEAYLVKADVGAHCYCPEN